MFHKNRTTKESRLDVDNEDDQESYFKARKDLPLIAYPDDEEEIEYDDDGNPIPPERSKVFTLSIFFSHYSFKKKKQSNI